MANFGPFGITQIKDTPASPTTATAVTLNKTSHWKDDTGATYSGSFYVVFRPQNTYPDYGIGEVCLVTAFDSTGITAMTRAQKGTTAIALSASMECYPYPSLADATTVVTTASELEIQTAMTNLSATGGGTVTVTGSLGAIPVTSGLTAKDNIFLNIDKGSWLSISGSSSINVLGYAGSSLSAGTAFTGTVAEGTNTGTLASGDEGLAADDYVVIRKTSNSVDWQVMKVKSVVGSVLTFHSTFGWAYTTAWKVHKISGLLSNFKFSGEIRSDGNTGATSKGISIVGFTDLDLRGLKTYGFGGGVSQSTISVNRGYNLHISGLTDDESGNVNLAALNPSSCSNVWIEHTQIDAAYQPFLGTLLVDAHFRDNHWTSTGAGRIDEMDTVSRVHQSGLVGVGAGAVGGGTGTSIVSGAVASFGAAFGSRHIYIDHANIKNCSVQGWVSFGDATDIHVAHSDYSGNNLSAASAEVTSEATDTDIFFTDVKTTAGQLQMSSPSFYYDGMVRVTKSPTLIQSGGLADTTVTYGRGRRDGKDVIEDYVLTIADATGAVTGNTIQIVLPSGAAVASAHTNRVIIGYGTFYDAGSDDWYPFDVWASTTAERGDLVDKNSFGAGVGFLGTAASNFNGILAANDIIKIHLEYELA